jgi:hypothetical protein
MRIFVWKLIYSYNGHMKKLLDERIGKFRVLLETSEGHGGGFRDYGIPRQAWLRAVKLATRHGLERALELIDERAERAGDRRDFETARRWRELIVAIHAIQEDERLPGDNMH